MANSDGVQILSIQQVRDIHLALVEMFRQQPDPIEPHGERPGGLLESAVARQLIGAQNHLIYADPISNAATLVYGLCTNHPFHNGNKRTALVSLLVHLDANGYIFREGIDHRLVYEFIVALADHGLHRLSYRHMPPIPPGVNPEDYAAQMAMCTAWLKENSRSIRLGDRPLRMRDLRRILASFQFELADPQQNYADIYTTEKVVQHIWLGIGRRVVPMRKKVFQIACAGMNATVPVSTVKEVRRRCKLRDIDGVDSETFYRQLDPLDHFLNVYRNILKKLSAN